MEISIYGEFMVCLALQLDEEGYAGKVFTMIHPVIVPGVCALCHIYPTCTASYGRCVGILSCCPSPGSFSPKCMKFC